MVGNFAFLFDCIHCSTHLRKYQSSFSDESDASTCISLVLVSFLVSLAVLLSLF